MTRTVFSWLFSAIATLGFACQSPGQSLEESLKQESPERLADQARMLGDPARGAILFYSAHMACSQCHAAGDADKPLGPDLSRPEQKEPDGHWVESILDPSRKIRKAYESIVLQTIAGETFTGLKAKETTEAIVLRDASRQGKLITIPKADIEASKQNSASIMPNGLVNQLASRQQFLDLASYVLEITSKGPARAIQLRPAASLVARAVPEYEARIDHAGMVADLNEASFKRGEAIYNRLCINCHGTKDQPGSLPTSLRFGSGKFKNGSDPYRMYQTLTKGFGMMVAQAWMVPQQKYDVIHYIREAYLKPSNKNQYLAVDEKYLAALPKGTTRGPAPSNIEPWSTMDYGASLIASYEIGRDASNFAYKGIAVRLDPGAGGVSRGRHWLVFDHDTLRVAAGWSGKGFIDWQGIMFNGRHAVHPRIAGQVQLANPTGPGWAMPGSDSFRDPRFRGRDDRPYGPLPRAWAQYKGLYHHGDQVVFSYTVGSAAVLELPGVVELDTQGVFTRSFEMAPHDEDLLLQVAHLPTDSATLAQLAKTETDGHAAVLFGHQNSAQRDDAKAKFDGETYLEIPGDSLNMTDSDYSIFARIKTTAGGTIFSKTGAGDGNWIPNGKTLFVRRGRLGFDIGWVGVVQSSRKINDGKWHDVWMTYDHRKDHVALYVDGIKTGAGRLAPKQPVKGHVARIGYTAADFPQPASMFKGEIERVSFFSELVAEESIVQPEHSAIRPLATWNPSKLDNGLVRNQAAGSEKENRLAATPRRRGTARQVQWVVAGTEQTSGSTVSWSADDNGNLRLLFPKSSEPTRLTVWTATVNQPRRARDLVSNLVLETPPNLRSFTSGGPARWAQPITTKEQNISNGGGFAVDVLEHPLNNPWHCRVRPTGFDFYENDNRAAVCTWDGDVWIVEGLTTSENELKWKRIASGLFQPLGLRIVAGKIYVTCRDQLVILNDLNGDGETDFYQCFNNDHQVTEHFHEFAMGLQKDAEGNFYYAKSARHAKTALVAHHGTLLRVDKDGKNTEIVATGFRAANGVCINPDGTFIVTDQEGHWNPKNRINWVREGGFYGNMFGYHDVTDSSDDAMEKPLCWITNSFDRSPAELLWVDSSQWGPLQGSLLNFSYGYGKVYVVPHENVDGQMQGGMCAIPIPQFPTGVMRGRFHPSDGQLYVCGMFAWAGTQHQPGGFYRIRCTGEPVHLPVGLSANQQGLEVRFSGKLDRDAATRPENYSVKVWGLKRTANYGSKHYDERYLTVEAAALSSDAAVVELAVPNISPTWCMEIKYDLKSSDGKSFSGVIHNTIHSLR